MAETVYPGARLGLPETGPGSAATIGRRVAAFAIDAVLAAAVTWPFTAPDLPRNWSLVTFFVVYTVGTMLLGRSPGMMLTRMRLDSDQVDRRWWPVKAVGRTALLMLVLPAVLLDENRRGLHDKVAGTIVVNE